jgi:NADH dehydrogenase [ubiquinone] 1 alpha subcomplex assembly factor 1
MCDGDGGGLSTSNLEYVDPQNGEAGYAKWSGSISRKLPDDKPKLLIAGYAGFRTLDRQAHLFGKGFMNLDPYAFIAMRVKSDGRKYFVNIQTDSIEVTDIHQHRLYTKQPNKWETILIGINEFVRTNDGRVVEPQSDMLREKVNSIGISLTDREPGPFEIHVQKIWATNGLEGEEKSI